MKLYAPREFDERLKSCDSTQYPKGRDTVRDQLIGDVDMKLFETALK